jgi:WD40 repeat protein
MLWDVASGRQLKVIQLDQRADTVAFSANGRQALIAPGYGGAPQLFDLQSGAEVLRLDENNSVRGVAFSPDGNSIVTGNAKTVSVWDVQSRQRIQQFTIPGGSLFVMALSPNGKSLVTGSEQPQGVHVRLWDVASGQQLREFADPAPVNAVAFSPDGKYILSGDREYVARLWEASSGQLVHTFVGHTFSIWGVGFSPDGKYVLTASQDRTVRLWDASTGQQLRLFPSHANAAVANAIFAPDGRSIVIGSFDGVAQQTPTDLDDLIYAICTRLLRDLTGEERTIYGITNPTPPCQIS